MENMKISNTLLEKMKDISQKNVVADSKNVDETRANFLEMLQNKISEVNEQQELSSKLQEEYTMGNPEVSLAQVMVESQKSTVYTQFTIQARNKIVDAYKEIMNMSV